jgi:hypothetical protein
LGEDVRNEGMSVASAGKRTPNRVGSPVVSEQVLAGCKLRDAVFAEETRDN